MTDREKLAEWIFESINTHTHRRCNLATAIAETLIAKGVIVPPPKDKQTQVDRIRAMSDIELAAYLYSLDDVGIGFCLDKGRCMEESDEDVVIPTDDDCMACMIAWIQSPAEGGDER